MILVVVLVLGAIWLDRDRHDPVAGYGIIPQPGVSELPIGSSAPAVGDPAPNFRLQAANGDIVELADLRGQPVVVHFWTTWCLDCTSELPDLQHLSASHADRAHIIGVDVGEAASRVTDAATDRGATYPMLLDQDKEVAHYYGFWEYPVTLVIDAQGVISAIHDGIAPVADLERELDAALVS